MVQVRDRRGKMHTKRFKNPDDATEWYNLMVRNRQRKSGGLQGIVTPKPFYEGVCEWLQATANDNKKKRASTTIETHEYRSRYWLKLLSKDEYGNDRMIRDIEFDEIEAGLDAMDCSPASYNRHRSMLSMMWKYFKRKRWVDENFIRDTESGDETYQVRKTGFWETREEMDRYVRAMFEVAFDCDEQPRARFGQGGKFIKGPRPIQLRTEVWGYMAKLMLFSGITLGECCALKWFDLHEGKLRVRRIREKRSGRIAERTKRRAMHAIPLLPEVLVALNEWKAKTHFNRPLDFILHDEHGHPLSHSHFTSVHKRAIRRAGLPYIAPHDLRRTFATNVETLGSERRETQMLLRHKNIMTTEKYIGKDVRRLGERVREFGSVLKLERGGG